MIQQNAQTAALPAQTDMPGLADATLVDRVRAGDSAAFELIMRRYNRRLYRLARGVLKNGAEAEDAVQEAYVRAYEKIADFIGPNGFSAWLGRIVVNEALGRLRKRGRVISFDDYARGAEGGADVRRIETMTTRQPDPERLAASGELRRLLEDAIDTLPDDFRTVFVLRAVEGMSVAETAEVLSIRAETVKTRFHRARLLLQGALGAQFDALMPSAFAFGGEHCDRVVAAVLARLGPSFEAAPRPTDALSKRQPRIQPADLSSTRTSGKED
ncbi:MAG: RNA polymerase sigma factor [Rhodospirillales bacterium]|nr:RNA polymerase sigma factor [Rhodospirillales bacterium]